MNKSYCDDDIIVELELKSGYICVVNGTEMP
ncbi:MAG: hypothetical protein HPY66_2690 [Firmicutes bacterium]|nr:hypothetical protein [Bacillota bacterium]